MTNPTAYQAYAAGAQQNGIAMEPAAAAVNRNEATPSAACENARKLTKLPRALMEGTRGMRAAGARAVGNAQFTEWLPREPAEKPEAYNARLYRSFLFNAFRKTVKDMTGKVFQRPVVLGEDMPDLLKQCAENIDMAGRHLNVFARDVFFDGMVTGIGYILVDMPPAVKRADGSPATLAEEQAAKLRPYFCYVTVESLLGWQSELRGGAPYLTQVRIMETDTEKDGDFNEVEVPQVRVLYPGRWETYRMDKQAANGRDKAWILYEQGETSIKDYIPIVPVYINRTGFMTGAPPLEDLADLNVEHWQSASDQRNILHVARVPILFGAGFPGDAEIAIGPNTMVTATDASAKLQWVEHTGAAIEAGRNDLKDIELRMQVQGLQLLIPQPGGQTATGEVRDEAKENSPLAMMANALGDALENAFAMAADFLGLGHPDQAGGSVTVNTNFGVGTLGGIDLSLLLNATNSDLLSKDTFWTELKRRDVLADDFDPDAEKDRLQTEAPALNGSPMNLEQ